MKKKISLLTPTRKRFDKLKKMVEQLANVDLEIVVGIDLDDNTSIRRIISKKGD